MPEATRKIQVLISSSRADLLQYREEASVVIKRVAADVEKRVQLLQVSMEKETQSGDREFPVAVSKRWVDQSDWVVVIVGWNYGTISEEEGANGLSVTEWEYRHAVRQRKKTFVFVAGEPRTANEYRVSSEEREDLKNWNLTQDEVQKSKLKKFKEDVELSHVEMFMNLAHFRERLEKTLRNAIDDLPPDLQPGSALAELVLGLTPAIRACTRQVALIADGKRIHDCLHELHQQVIRRLREEVLPRWHQDGTLSQSKERLLGALLGKASRRLGAIEQMRSSIAPDYHLLRSLDALLELPPLWDVESGPPPSSDQFADQLDDFAARARQAFYLADRSMATEERALDVLHARLLEGISEARRKRYLSRSEDEKLDEEIRRIGANKSRLASALARHHAWQEAHEKLEVLGDFRETDRFDTALWRSSQTDLSELLDLVLRELSTAVPDDANDTEGLDAANKQAAPPSPSPSMPLVDAARTEESDFRRLAEHLEALKPLGNMPREEARGKGASIFDQMRVIFNDAFYDVNKRTLRDVLRAKRRVEDFEQLLQVLANANHQATEA
jgi:hypothetical protein